MVPVISDGVKLIGLVVILYDNPNMRRYDSMGKENISGDDGKHHAFRKEHRISQPQEAVIV